ncbi:hypothetical protein [Chloracidobacterium thermophilum]|uniref:hypothetical protein n=1 Tax=Chloracidobacterium thermophilum TaxID=458033 RepID=UPI002018139F|nr:hypothetical protein [Chloracidobacterium thermophilum]
MKQRAVKLRLMDEAGRLPVRRTLHLRVGAETGRHHKHQHNNHKGHNPGDTAVFSGHLQTSD